MASEQEPANFVSISQIADGINHTVPTHKELQTCLGWLKKTGLSKSQPQLINLNQGVAMCETRG